MCKIFTLTNASKIKSFTKATKVIRDLVSETERDGFGYAVQTTKGVFGERTVEPEEFLPGSKLSPLNLPFAESLDNSFGIRGTVNGSAIFHGRTSTNTRSLLNTHPIQKYGWTLIHNGVVSNNGPQYEMMTSNDTEHLIEFLATEGIGAVESHLTGYYAVNALGPDGRLHVFRDSIAPLNIGWIESIESFAIATRASHIEKFCKAMGYKHGKINPIHDNAYVVFSGNEFEVQPDVKPRGRTSVESVHASKSLGVELDDPSGNVLGEVFESERFSEDEIMFLKEVTEFADSSYSFFDYRNGPITLADFKALSDDEKTYCTVIRPDGTVCSPDDYYSDRFYEGA